MFLTNPRWVCWYMWWPSWSLNWYACFFCQTRALTIDNIDNLDYMTFKVSQESAKIPIFLGKAAVLILGTSLVHPLFFPATDCGHVVFTVAEPGRRPGIWPMEEHRRPMNYGKFNGRVIRNQGMERGYQDFFYFCRKYIHCLGCNMRVEWYHFALV